MKTKFALGMEYTAEKLNKTQHTLYKISIVLNGVNKKVFANATFRMKRMDDYEDVLELNVIFGPVQQKLRAAPTQQMGICALIKSNIQYFNKRNMS